jgi:chemotaxis protein CheX
MIGFSGNNIRHEPITPGGRTPLQMKRDNPNGGNAMSFIKKVLESIELTEERLVKLLIGDIREVFSTMVGMEDLLHLPVVIDPETHFENCVTAMIGLAGAYSGIVIVHTPTPLALQITSSMLGMDVEEMNEDVSDALGEIANMIAGSFKQHLSSCGADTRISTPSVVTGSDYDVSAGTAQNSITLRFLTDDSWFIVGITLDEE